MRDLSKRLASIPKGAEREMLEEARHENNQNRTTTARMLGLSRVGLYKKMKKYGMITPRKTRSREAS